MSLVSLTRLYSLIKDLKARLGMGVGSAFGPDGTTTLVMRHTPSEALAAWSLFRQRRLPGSDASMDIISKPRQSAHDA